MITRSRRRTRVPIPAVTTTKTTTTDIEFVKGLNTNSGNDEMPKDQWRVATDVREIQIGKWETRKGADPFSIPIGEAVNVQQTSTTGASDFSFNTSTWFAKKIVAAATGPLTALEVNIKNPLGAATGTVVVAAYSDDSGAPGDELVRSTIANSDIGTSYAYEKARSITCPTITNAATYWVVGYVQAGGTGSYQISTTTNASTGLSSTNSGATWSAASVDFNVKLTTATAGGVKGVKRVQAASGATHTFLTHGSTLYSVNEGTGVTTSIDTGLNASATYTRFAFVNDTLYYVTALQKPRKHVIGSGSASEVSGALGNASNVIEHKGLLFYIDADDPTQSFYTNFAVYDTFTSTDFIYVPAPKTGDPVTAMAKLNGLLFYVTRNSKYVLFGAENATFRLEEAIGQKGTFSQESVAYDQNYIFLASDDGIYQFNGAEEKNITAQPDGGVLKTWTDLLAKESAVLEIHGNRLYVWYTPNGGSENSRCLVYNYNYGIWESIDTKAYVHRTHSRFDPDDYLLIGSNRAGMLMLQERSTNDYNVMGEPVSFELGTAFNHYDSPAQLKRASKFRPHFETVDGDYAVQVGYATDFAESPTYSDVDLQGSGVTFNSGVLFNSGAVFGAAGQVNPLDSGPDIPGQWRRLQLRYKHEAAREPVSFEGHILELEAMRMT